MKRLPPRPNPNPRRRRSHEKPVAAAAAAAALLSLRQRSLFVVASSSSPPRSPSPPPTRQSTRHVSFASPPRPQSSPQTSHSSVSRRCFTQRPTIPLCRCCHSCMCKQFLGFSSSAGFPLHWMTTRCAPSNILARASIDTLTRDVRSGAARSCSPCLRYVRCVCTRGSGGQTTKTVD